MSAFSLWEGGFLLWLQNGFRGTADGLMLLLSRLGDLGLLWILLTLLLFCFKGSRKTGLASAFALLASVLLCNLLLKNIVARVRPFEALPLLTALGPVPTDFSFPSGHSSSAFAAATAIARGLGPKYGVPALLLAVLIAFSRLYLGVHYPSDILFGCLLGILCGLCGTWLAKRLSRESRQAPQ